jgi:decaprenylphospho-beta-D-erythro-pentofuranosid-2-ulose 2-reductase
MNVGPQKTVLVLGANSDVAKEAIRLYIRKGYFVIAASRNTSELKAYFTRHNIPASQIEVLYFDATAFETHQAFYNSLAHKPNIVVYAAGYLKNNEEALLDFDGAFQMMKVHYCGAVSILNIVAMDQSNEKLERIVGLSSLSGVRGRKSNFIYGSTKSAFTQYLAGLRQYLFSRNITVNVIVAGYIRSKMISGLRLRESLILEPEFIASAVVDPGSSFIIVPGLKWKVIYQVLRLMPESLAARLP